MKIVRHSHLKNTLTVFTFMLVAGLGQALQADSTIHPVKMNKAQIAGGIFQDHEPVVATHDGNTTYDVEVFLIYVIYSPGGPIEE